MSLIKMRNNTGPKMDPCCTQLMTYNQSDTHPFKTTLCCVLFNHSPIQNKTWPDIPCSLILLNNLACGTLSNAFWKSRNIDGMRRELGLPEKCTHHIFKLITAQLELRLGLVLVLVCVITTANRLSLVVHIDYKNKMWCTFQVDPNTFLQEYIILTIRKPLNLSYWKISPNNLYFQTRDVFLVTNPWHVFR